MGTSDQRSIAYAGGAADTWETVRRAFAEFLTLPTGTIIGFLLLAAGTFVLDRSEVASLEPARAFLKTQIFTDAKATSDLLSTIASGLITVTSITISLLLLALQQATGFLTTEVCDQFLRRRLNQLYFGFFVGLSLFALITLATVNERFNPVFGATLAFLLTVGALYLLILLLYTTINQMRPVEIIEEIHRLTLLARERQLGFLRKIRRVSRYDGAGCVLVKATKHGYVTGIDIDAIGHAARRAGDHVEVVLLVRIGSFVAWHDGVAYVKDAAPDEAMQLEQVVQGAIHLERQRDIVIDSAYGIEQLEMIAWTSISTAKSNPAPGLLTIRRLRDVLARWSGEAREKTDDQTLPVVYDDNTFARLMDAFENLAVVSSESMQHQTYIEVVHTLTTMFERVPIDHQRRAEDIILRILSVLGDHVLTAELDAALSALVGTLRATARFETADAVHAAQEQLGRSIGKLNSHSTRVARA
ncbi:MAG: DUF2254 domain-containing protein [Nitrospira sp.]|nr:DUF2254 domain-containing protein [Nitrospira sp.]